MATPASLHPVDDKLRVLDLQVVAPDGAVLDLQLPWDRSAFDLEPVLVAGTAHDHDDRSVVAYPAGAQDLDVLEVPLGKALRHDENPEGADELVILVEASEGVRTFTVRCAGVAEPAVHQEYPRARGGEAAVRLEAYHAVEDAEWFCDGSGDLACCAQSRQEPEAVTWVAV